MKRTIEYEDELTPEETAAAIRQFIAQKYGIEVPCDAGVSMTGRYRAVPGAKIKWTAVAEDGGGAPAADSDGPG